MKSSRKWGFKPLILVLITIIIVFAEQTLAQNEVNFITHELFIGVTNTFKFDLSITYTQSTVLIVTFPYPFFKYVNAPCYDNDNRLIAHLTNQSLNPEYSQSSSLALQFLWTTIPSYSDTSNFQIDVSLSCSLPVGDPFPSSTSILSSDFPPGTVPNPVDGVHTLHLGGRLPSADVKMLVIESVTSEYAFSYTMTFSFPSASASLLDGSYNEILDRYIYHYEIKASHSGKYAITLPISFVFTDDLYHHGALAFPTPLVDKNHRSEDTDYQNTNRQPKGAVIPSAYASYVHLSNALSYSFQDTSNTPHRVQGVPLVGS